MAQSTVKGAAGLDLSRGVRIGRTFIGFCSSAASRFIVRLIQSQNLRWVLVIVKQRSSHDAARTASCFSKALGCPTQVIEYARASQRLAERSTPIGCPQLDACDGTQRRGECLASQSLASARRKAVHRASSSVNCQPAAAADFVEPLFRNE